MKATKDAKSTLGISEENNESSTYVQRKKSDHISHLKSLQCLFCEILECLWMVITFTKSVYFLYPVSVMLLHIEYINGADNLAFQLSFQEEDESYYIVVESWNPEFCLTCQESDSLYVWVKE